MASFFEKLKLVFMLLSMECLCENLQLYMRDMHNDLAQLFGLSDITLGNQNSNREEILKIDYS